MGLWSKVKSTVSKAYKSVDKAVGGRLPGGVAPSSSGSSSSSGGSSSGSSSSGSSTSGGSSSGGSSSSGLSRSGGSFEEQRMAAAWDEAVKKNVAEQAKKGIYEDPILSQAPSGTGLSRFSISGRGSSNSKTQSTNQYSPQNKVNADVSKDIPNSYETEAKRQTYKDIPSYFKETYKREGIYQAVKGSAEIGAGSIGRGVSKIEKPVVAGTEWILRKGGIEESPAVQLQKDKSLKETEVNTFNREAERYSNEVNTFNKKWENKTISSTEELKKYNEEKSKLESKQNLIKNKEKILINSLKELDTKEKQIERNPRTFAKTLFNSVAVGVVTLPFAVAKFGANFVSSPIQTIEGVGEGLKSIPSAVAQRPASTIGELTGSIIGSLIFAGGVSKLSNLKNVAKLNEAKSIALRSSAEIKSVSGISTETDLLKLSIPQTEKAQLMWKIKAGESLRLVEYELKAPTTYEQNILNKYAPVKSIKTIEKVDTVGNVVEQVVVGKIKIGGKKDFIQNIYSEGIGIRKGGVTRMETLTLGVEEKGVTSATRASQIIEGQIKRAGLNKISLSKSKIAETTIEGTSKKPLKFEDLRDLSNKKFNEYQLKTSKQLDVQQLSSVKQLEISTQEKAFLAQEKKYLIKGSVVKTEAVPKPIEFERISKGKIKPFTSEEIIKTLTPEEIIKETSNRIAPKTMQTQIPKTEIDIKEITPLYISPQIQKAVKTSIEQTKTNQQVIPNIQTDFSQGISKELNQITNQLDSPIIKIKQKEKTKQKGSTKINTKVDNLSKVNEVVNTKVAVTPKIKIQQFQPLKLQQIQTLKPITSLTIPTPTIPKIPPIINFGSFKQCGGFISKKKLSKKAKKAEAKYAANLASAAFQRTPIKVTRKQYEKLIKKKKYFTSLPVLEVIPKKKKSKSFVDWENSDKGVKF